MPNLNIRFFAPEPRQRARPELDGILRAGTEQLAIASPFLASGGVELLRSHAARLRLPPSFVVVAFKWPTTIEILNELYRLIPGKLYLHLGSKTPWEEGVGSGLMHSKVFLARGAERSCLWTGSHNLTASAVQGVNCEAAILVEGHRSESIFADALNHLERCRAESILYDPKNPPPEEPEQRALIIHAEQHVPLRPLPWHIHLRPGETTYDEAMRPPAQVWLYLYDTGALELGRRRPHPKAAYSGTITALNFTERHPRYPGVSADWAAANYVIEPALGVPRLVGSAPHTQTPSQGIFHIRKEESPDVVWLNKLPGDTLQPVLGDNYISEVDEDFRRFFTKSSLSREGLVHRPFCDLKSSVALDAKEVGDIAELELKTRLRLAQSTELRILDVKKNDKFAFIYRAKYRR